ncbi:type I methionyl aminopeptidase [Alicyclobacillus sp. ALC3]|uniref:type I methionyl aminopeptidase n=1 Tax=Alicyclobacillus sp. ALC3 TaxID=2796143 RepID=UPI00237991B7|nr:type I methionyl aminopeptidase [Alicyclobacillus sp. ALC3]WDL96359.1 type I methionyl aminopeptidase [Alicyclobacillus sp. ALC3]
MIRILSQSQVQRLRIACSINAAAHRAAAAVAHPGATTKEVEQAAFAELTRWGGEPSFITDAGFPSSACISVNDETGHGIPGSRRLQAGDVVKVDIGVLYQGLHSDAARTIIIGDARPTRVYHLVRTTENALRAGIAAAQPGRRLSDVSSAVAETVRAAGLAVVKSAFGHGIGESLHEEPSVANFGPPGLGPILRPGMAICIEPVVCEGSGLVTRRGDGWTDVTVDGSLAAHFEHTVLITGSGPQVLTAQDPREASFAPCWVGEGEPIEAGVWCRTMRPGEETEVFEQVAAVMDPVLISAFGRRAKVDEVLGVADSQVVVVETEGGKRGFVVLSRTGESMHVHVLAVSRSFQQNGLGRKIMQKVEAIARLAECRQVTLCVQTSNPRAQSFYTRLGYEVVGPSYVNTLDMYKLL